MDALNSREGQITRTRAKAPTDPSKLVVVNKGAAHDDELFTIIPTTASCFSYPALNFSFSPPTNNKTLARGDFHSM